MRCRKSRSCVASLILKLQRESAWEVRPVQDTPRQVKTKMRKQERGGEGRIAMSRPDYGESREGDTTRGSSTQTDSCSTCGEELGEDLPDGDADEQAALKR